MAKNKKPTMMEVKNVLGNLIQEVESLGKHVSMVDNILMGYLNYKQEADEFKKWLSENTVNPNKEEEGETE
jgi:hypothetical protein